MKSNFQESRNHVPSEPGDLDHALDAALVKYSAVEPRTGVEERILAQLRSDQNTIPARSWWTRGALGAAAAFIAIITVLGWNPSRPATKVVQQASAPIRAVQPPATGGRANSTIVPILPLTARRTSKAIRHPVRKAVVAADEPKLDRFPSPEPLTQEELALVRYVRQFPSDAVMLASAQEEFEKEIEQEGTAGRQVTSNSKEKER